MKILKATDLICFKHNEIEIKVSPLTYLEKVNVLTERNESNKSLEEQTKFSINLFRQCVKELKGIIDYNGNEYQLEFGEDGRLTESCALELINYFDQLPANTISTDISIASFGKIAEGFSVLGK